MRLNTHQGLKLSAVAAAVSSLFISVGISAQEAAVNNDSKDVERVIVTGSRIARDINSVNPVPIRTISADDIQLSGESNIVDLVAKEPSLLFSDSENNIEDNKQGAGANVLNLRAMGPERTLTLVNGRRHVAGVAGTQAVDVGSIPAKLLKRVEVITGGASAVYGADAVTGVVNFVLQDDYEGFEVDARTGISAQGDANTLDLSILAGNNFANGRGNITLALDYNGRDAITYGDRDWARNNGIATDLPNPALRFQVGDLDPASTPYFASLYAAGAGIEGACNQASTDGISLSSAENALCQRAANAPSHLIGSGATYSASSIRGIIRPNDYDHAAGIDLDGNGIDDCDQGYIGCWVMGDDGKPRPFQNGLIAGSSKQFGGDGSPKGGLNNEFLLPDIEKYSLNLLSRYELMTDLELFLEAKYVKQQYKAIGGINTFNDDLYIAADNPFIPDDLQQLAKDAGGLWMNRDQTDIGHKQQQERETIRVVAGLKGFVTDNIQFDVAANYGRFQRISLNHSERVEDRWFAAIDATTDAQGHAVCRSSLTGQAPEHTSSFPYFDPGFFTFSPDDGQCTPINLFGTISDQAVAFVTTTAKDKRVLEQYVLTANLFGELEDIVELPGGPLSWAAGVEYREEHSDSSFDPLRRGIIPAGSPHPAGTFVGDVSDNQSLTFDPTIATVNSGGKYDVIDYYVELSAPLLEGMMLADELTVDGAFRLADYSTIGTAKTWKLGVAWAPVEQLRLRATLSQAVRAPNIGELFDPEQGQVFDPDDPCDSGAIASLKTTNPVLAARREANCRADGIPKGYTNPLTARFSGLTSGNPDLSEETAETITYGVAWSPSFIDGLTLIADYWRIEIEDAIADVSAQKIVDNCYDSVAYPNNFCDLFSRNRDENSPTYRGFNFLRQTKVNFGRIESDGLDFSLDYQFAVEAHKFGLNLAGTKVYKNDSFFDPTDANAVDPELGQYQRPELAASLALNWQYRDLSVVWSSRYQHEQALSDVEIETYIEKFGPAAIADEVYIHDLSAKWQATDKVAIYGGITNVSDEKPFSTATAWPVSPVGRAFFFGVDYQM